MKSSFSVRAAPRSLASVGLVGLMAIGLAADPAKAQQPVRQVVTDYGYTEPFDCGSFTVVYTTDLRVTDLLWSDANGNAVRVVETLHNMSQTWTNPSNGMVLQGFGGGYTYQWQSPNEYGTFTGHAATITEPGSGVVLKDAGRIQVVGWEPPFEFPFVAGRHDVWFDRGLVCSLLVE